MTIKNLLATLLPTFLSHEKAFVSKQSMPSSDVIHYTPVMATLESPNIWGEVVAPSDGYLMIKNYKNRTTFIDLINGTSSDLQSLIIPNADGYGAVNVPAKAGDVLRYHLIKIDSSAEVMVMFVKTVGCGGG